MSGAKGAGQSLRRQSAFALGAAALLFGAAAAIWWLSSGAGDVVHIADPRRPTPTPVVAVAPDTIPASPEVRPTIRKVAGMKRLGATTRPSPQFIMSMASDPHGRLWIGTEDTGVFCYSPSDQRWRRFTTADGLGDDHAYAVACDRQGRIWVGHLNHGVSVYVEGFGEEGTKARRHEGTQGKWQNYEVVGGLSSPTSLSGPLGERVFDVAVCPTDGDVWIATDHGLSRYRQASDDWLYYTRAEGLPSDQVQALAFGPDGTLYAGTQCDGIAIAKAKEQYRTWRTVIGPERMPTVPAGEGLPTSLINDLLVGSDGTIYAATTLGLALSRDGGTSWRYWRGGDWADKVRGLYGGPPAGWREEPGARLAEDYVTCLAEAGPGKVLVGYRRRGCELLETERGEMRRAMPLPFYANALVPLGQNLFLGGYGEGLVSIPATSPAQVSVMGAAVPVDPVPLPSGAKPPTEAELAGMLERVRAIPSASSMARYLGADWSTQGDWMVRYGRQYAVLCGANSPLDHWIGFGEPYGIDGNTGPHIPPDDGMRRWVHWLKTDSRRSLWNPYVGYRRQAEWDDHGEAFQMSHEGPDLWVKLSLPPGVYRVSLYFMNKDGDEAANRYRDYLLLLRRGTERLEQALSAPVLARGRVRDFRKGVYQQFLLSGDQTYWLQISRNGSFNTICSGVFIDKLVGPVTTEDRMPRPMMGNLYYDPPTAPDLGSCTGVVRTSADLWSALDEALGRGDGAEGLQGTDRILAYRAAEGGDAPADLLANWRWALRLWTEQDRARHEQMMAAAWDGMKRMNPGLGKVVEDELRHHGLLK